jgi:hypothetical protein
MNQPLDLDAIQARCDAATPGPWGHYEGDDYADVAANYQATGRGSYTCLQQVARIEADWHFDDPRHADCEDEDAATQAHADAAFLAAARTDVPALLAEVQRLTARAAEENQRAHRAEGRLDAALDVVEQWADHCLGPQTRNLLDEIRATLNPQPAPGSPQTPAPTTA